MKHTERVIKTQTPIQQGPAPDALITATVCGYLNPLCCCVCMCVCLPVEHALDVCVFVHIDTATDLCLSPYVCMYLLGK